MIVQTRSEENGLAEFSTLKEAFVYASKDQSIWKISFTIDTGERVRLVSQENSRTEKVWIYETIEDAMALGFANV